MSPSERIDNEIASLADWRGQRIAEIRTLVKEVIPDVTEDWKWNTPVWSRKGMICAVAAFKDHVKINFFKGASLPDPGGIFNAGLDAKATRAIDLRQGDELDSAALSELLAAAAALNANPKT